MVRPLTSTEARQRLEKFGYNELPSAKPKNIWRIALEVMKEPMFILLISCGVLYMILGDYREGGVLLSTILIIIFITFYQYQKTEKTLQALRQLSSPRALVIRDKKEIRIPGREVVPGDIIRIEEGDRVPADARLLEETNLTIDESLLTGESVAVTKSITHDPLHVTGQVFSGTLVVQGKGVAQVLSTGVATSLGKIGASLQRIESVETRLQREMKVFIKNVFILGAIISLGVVAAFYFTRGNFINALLIGLSASIAILPEEFPVVFTVFLALGAWRLSKKNVLTRKPSAIESLGSATVLCSDKTGTITQNKMEIAAVYDGKKSILKAHFAEYKSAVAEIAGAAHHASQKDSIDPMEKAILNVFLTLPDSTHAAAHLVREYPISKELLAVTRVLQRKKETGKIVFSKGAPEVIFTLCGLNDAERANHEAATQQLAEQGYRVIAVARALYQHDILPKNVQEFDFTFLGLVAFEDPVRPEVPAAIKECNDAGIKVIMITGDYPATAKSIALQIGMNTESGILSGDEVMQMSDEALRLKIPNVNVFARVQPEQKLRIVQALKANNEIVAMTGDGVNDAPALKAAHIGIAMGGKGTDVAREASSLVLLDDNFASIVAAIRSGRRIFDNMQKAMFYILAIHVPIIGLTLLPAFNPALPLLLMPLHIVFMELIIDPVCSIAFEYEQEEKGIMKRPPRDPDEAFFGRKRIFFSVLEGLLLFGMVVGVYFFSVYERHTEGEARAITFSALIIGNVSLILTNLSRTRSFLAVILEGNLAMVIILSAAILMMILIISVPVLQQLFSFEFPGYQHFIVSVSAAAGMLLLLESLKLVFRNKHSGRPVHT